MKVPSSSPPRSWFPRPPPRPRRRRVAARAVRAGARRLHPHDAHRPPAHRAARGRHRPAPRAAPRLVSGRRSRRRARGGAHAGRAGRAGRRRRPRRPARSTVSASAATAAAPAAPGRHPVLLLSPGLSETTALQSAPMPPISPATATSSSASTSPGETVRRSTSATARLAPVRITRGVGRDDRAAHARPALRARQARARCAASAGSTATASARSATPTAARPPRTLMLADRRIRAGVEHGRRHLRPGPRARPGPPVRDHAWATRSRAATLPACGEFRSAPARPASARATTPAPATTGLHRQRLAGAAARARPRRGRGRHGRRRHHRAAQNAWLKRFFDRQIKG